MESFYLLHFGHLLAAGQVTEVDLGLGEVSLGVSLGTFYDDLEDGVAAAALHVHGGLADVPVAFCPLDQGHTVLVAGDTVLR